MKTSKYWISQILPIAIVGYGAFHFHEFLMLAVKSNPALNSTILGAILISAGVCLWRMWAFSREAKTVARFGHRYEQTRDTHAAAQALSANRTYMAAMLRVVGDMRGALTSRLNQATLHLEFEELKSSYSQMMALPQFLSGFMIALGLFGTFVGLLETLGATASFIAVVANSSGGDADGAIVGLIKGIQGPLAGMGTAFSASLFGLLGSLVTGAMVNGLQSFSHQLLYRTRRMVEQVLPVESEPAAVLKTEITPEQLMGLAERLMHYEKSAVELYVRSKQADLEARAQFKDVSRTMGSLATTMQAMVEQLVPSGDAMAHQASQMAELVREIRRQNNLLGGIPDVVDAVQTSVKEVQRTGANVERSLLSAALMEKQHAVLIEGQLNQTHAVLRHAVQALSQRQEAADGALMQIAQGAQSLPTISEQLAQWMQLASELTQANASWLSGVQEMNAQNKAQILSTLDKLEQEFGRLARMNAATVEQTHRIAEEMRKQPSGGPADAKELMRQMSQTLTHSLSHTLSHFQAAQEELLKEVWRRNADIDTLAVRSHEAAADRAGRA